VDKNAIRETYNHTQYLEGYREMVLLYTGYITVLIKVSITPHYIPLDIGIWRDNKINFVNELFLFIG